MSVLVPSKFKDLGIALRLPSRDRGKRICGCLDAVLVGVVHLNSIAGAANVGKLSMPSDAGVGVAVRAFCDAGAALCDIKLEADCLNTTALRTLN